MCLFFFSLACKRPDGEARILYIYIHSHMCVHVVERTEWLNSSLSFFSPVTSTHKSNTSPHS